VSIDEEILIIFKNIWKIVGKWKMHKYTRLTRYTGWGIKKYDCLNWCNIKTKRAMRIKQVYWHSAISSLNFDICYALTFPCHIEKDTFLELRKLAKNGY
jgi:hypothetical protein